MKHTHFLRQTLGCKIQCNSHSFKITSIQNLKLSLKEQILYCLILNILIVLSIAHKANLKFRHLICAQ